ncbi:MAG: hypothetical protein CFE26_01300 [Verrucomicrobiales bacterium VVV1]|nr:MAG: hypothetical protein CFE26_01300 [Verrucomicrobiales bacterium VVV1]
MSGSDGEALAIEFCAPLLARVPCGEVTVFLPVDSMSSGFISRTNAVPVRGGKAFRHGFRSRRLCGERVAGETGEEDNDRFYFLERLGSGKKSRQSAGAGGRKVESGTTVEPPFRGTKKPPRKLAAVEA